MYQESRAFRTLLFVDDEEDDNDANDANGNGNGNAPGRRGDSR